MSALLYIHGFLSSPKSHKAIQMGEWLKQHRPQIRYLCPFLTPYPDLTRNTLEQLVEQHLPGPLYLMGSSLGGFWATWLAEKYGLRAVLINPAVDLGLFNQKYINTDLKNYHTDDTYKLTEEHIAGFKSSDIPVVSLPEKYMLLVQTGDEVLDYRQAVQKYTGCKQIIDEGGDHTFDCFDTYIADAISFLEAGQ